MLLISKTRKAYAEIAREVCQNSTQSAHRALSSFLLSRGLCVDKTSCHDKVHTMCLQKDLFVQRVGHTPWRHPRKVCVQGSD